MPFLVFECFVLLISLNFTMPLDGLLKPRIIDSKVDFPDPLSPNIPILSPFIIWRLTSLKTSLESGYLNDKFLISIWIFCLFQNSVY